MITVIDYGMGNSGSILNILARIGAEGRLTCDLGEIAQATRLVLPGVGAFDKGMERLHGLGLVALLNKKVIDEQTPILGICLGMQLFARTSEEGRSQGLGWFDAHVRRFQFDEAAGGAAASDGARSTALPIPHMGWNTLTLRKPHPTLDDLADDARFYFVHSYHVCCDDPRDVLATTNYGIEFVSAIASNSILGVQFHPEKSLRWGMNVFRNFVNMPVCAPAA